MKDDRDKELRLAIQRVEALEWCLTEAKAKVLELTRANRTRPIKVKPEIVVQVPSKYDSASHGFKGKRTRLGRPPKADWQMVRTEVFRLMDHYGGFMDADISWNCQARLEEKIFEYCQAKKWDPSTTQLRQYVSKALAEWHARQESE